MTDAEGLARSTLTLPPEGDGKFVVKAWIKGTDKFVKFTTSRNPLSSMEDPRLTPNQREMVRTLDDVCSRLETTRKGDVDAEDLLDQCKRLQKATTTGSVDDAVETIVALTPDQAGESPKMATRVTGVQLNNIATRLSALCRGARGTSLHNLMISFDDSEHINAGTVADLLKGLGGTGGGAPAVPTRPASNAWGSSSSAIWTGVTRTGPTSQPASMIPRPWASPPGWITASWIA